VHPSLTLTLGGRGDYNTRYGGTFNPRVGLVWQPTATSNVKVLYGSAFLAPSPYQQYLHYGSFYSTDGGDTYASEFWHLPNPDLQPQRRSTTEIAARQSLGASIEVWGSAFYSHLSDVIRESVDRADRYAGTYKGWPVSLIEVSVNEGHGHTYGGTVGADLLRIFGTDRQISGRVSLSLADGRIDNGQDVEIGGMAPVQMQMSADLTFDRWSVSPRLSLVGTQRALAVTPDATGVLRRQTLDGFALATVNVRRRILSRLDAFVTVENALDARYRSINLRAFNNPEELIGAPQNPRRIIAGVQVRVP
jgi:outer membrane receptor protein involved in Fe transport